ncbi:MAG: nitrilase-related carbon-nitrogen hydrolase [Promethearchaeota archaeon]
MDILRVAAVNFFSSFGKVERNLAHTEYWAEKLAQQGVQLICFPEMSITGYSAGSRITRLTQPIPGSVTDTLLGIAQRYRVCLLAGLPEEGDDGHLYISQVVVSPDGLMGVYRKTVLFHTEKTFFHEGDSTRVFQYRGVTFGIQICYEASSTEVSAIQASQGAEVFFVPTGSLAKEPPERKRQRLLGRLLPKARTHSCHVVSCNLICSRAKNAGVAFIISPKGEILDEAVGTEEAAVIADI